MMRRLLGLVVVLGAILAATSSQALTRAQCDARFVQCIRNCQGEAPYCRYCKQSLLRCLKIATQIQITF